MSEGKANTTSQITPRDYHRTLAVKVYPADVSGMEKVGELSYYVLEGEDWKNYTISSEKDAVAFSTALSGDRSRKKKEESPGSVSLSLKRFDHFWYVFPQKADADLSFDVVRKHQSVITKGSSTIASWKDRKAIVLSRGGEPGEKKHASGLPDAGEFGLEVDGEKRKYFIYRNVLIGSNPECDIKCGFRPFIAFVTMYHNRPRLICLHFEEILVAGQKPEQSVVELKDGDEITIAGKVKIIVHLPSIQIDPLAARTDDNALCLLDTNSSGEVLERVFLPLGKSLTVGRGAGCDIVIDQKTLSRKHSQLIVYEDHLLVLDCYSRNGTFVNDEEIGRGRARPGDIVTFGDKNYLVSYYNG
jgi:hypothetical protein